MRYLINILLALSLSLAPELSLAVETPVQPQAGASASRQEAASENQTTAPSGADPVFKIEQTGDNLFSIELRDVELQDLLRVIAYDYKINLIMDKGIKGTVTASFHNVKIIEALERILIVNGYALVKEGDIYRVKSGLVSKIFKLNYISVAKILGKSSQGSDNASTSVSLQPDVTTDSVSSTTSPSTNETPAATSTIDIEGQSESSVSDLSTLLSPAGKVLYGKEPNSLLVIDYPDNIAQIENYINMIDTRPQQVIIDARVVEVTLDDTMTYGVNLKWLDMTNVDHMDKSEFFSNLAYKGVSTEYLAITLINKHISAVIKALSTVTKTDLLSAPRVATINNVKARIDIVQRVPYIKEETSTITTGAPTQTTKEVQFEDIGIALEVTPTITNNGDIIMDIIPEVSELKSWTRELTAQGWTEDDPNIPVTDSRKTQTKIVMKSNQTIVIGGLVKDKVTESVSKVPLLGDIPYLGELFKQTKKQKQKTELLIFVCPTIIGDEEAAGMAREERYGIGARYTQDREKEILNEIQLESSKRALDNFKVPPKK